MTWDQGTNNIFISACDETLDNQKFFQDISDGEIKSRVSGSESMCLEWDDVGSNLRMNTCDFGFNQVSIANPDP